MIDGRDVMAVLSISTAPTANLNQRHFSHSGSQHSIFRMVEPKL